jgi:hypothetical protein
MILRTSIAIGALCALATIAHADPVFGPVNAIASGLRTTG